MSEECRAEPRKRSSAWKRWLKRLGIALAVLLSLLLLVRGIILLRAGRAIRRELESIRAAHEPLNWEECLRTDRAGRVQADDDPSRSEMSRLYAAALAETKAWSKGKGQEAYDNLRKQDISDDVLNTLGEALQENRRALGLFRQATQHEGIAILPGSTADPARIMTDLALMREGARLLAAQALHSAALGDGDQAADWCIVLCRFVHAFPGNNLISGLVRIAIASVTCQTIERTQNMAPASPEKLRELTAAVSRLRDDTPIARILCGERLVGLYIFQSGYAQFPMPKLLARPNCAEYLQLLRRTIAIARKPFPMSTREMEAFARTYAGEEAGVFDALERLLAPALARGFEEAAMEQAKVRVVLAALAVRRARADGKSLPAALDELVPTYLDSVPLDPWTGASLCYRTDEKGCLIYSVSRNGRDDGGNGSLHGYYKDADVVTRVPR